MLQGDRILVAQGQDNPCYLLLKQANRHGLIAGASGTGKTVTFKVIAEAFSQAGVPVFMADVKGDISGLAEPGEDNEGMQKRIVRFGLEDVWSYRGCPVRFWDLLSGTGAPVRVTVTAKDDVNITLDANHEMAGKALNFRIELVEVK